MAVLIQPGAVMLALCLRSRQTIISPPPMIRKTPGINRSNGASAKNIQPSANVNGMLKYSNGARLLGAVNR